MKICQILYYKKALAHISISMNLLNSEVWEKNYLQKMLQLTSTYRNVSRDETLFSCLSADGWLPTMQHWCSVDTKNMCRNNSLITCIKENMNNSSKAYNQ